MKDRPLAVLTLLFVVFSLPLRGTDRAFIHGFVRDAETLEPLVYVNAYLNNTQYGTYTDFKGYFSIAYIQPGTYELIVTHIGYKPYRKVLKIDPGGRVFVNVKLKPCWVELDTLTVAGFRKGGNPGNLLLGTPEFNIAPRLGEPDLFRLISTCSGIVTTNDFNTRLYIRGSNADQNLILLDGIPVYNPYHLASILSTFDEDVVQLVTVSKSNIPVIYGNRIGALVDINVRDGHGKRREIYFNTSLISSKIRVEGTFKQVSYLFSIRRTYADFVINSLVRLKVLPPDLKFPYYFVDGIGKLVINATPGERVELTTYMGRDVYDLRIIDENPEAGCYLWQNLITGVNYTKIMSPTLTFSVRAGFSRFVAQLLPPDTLYTERINNNFSSCLFNSYLSYKSPIVDRIRMGFETYIHRCHLFSKGFSYEPIVFRSKYTPEVSIFFDVHNEFSNIGELNGGFRLQHFPGKKPLAFSPQISIGFHITDRQQVRIHAGLYHQKIMTIGTEDIVLSMFDAWVAIPDSFPPSSATQISCDYRYLLSKTFEIKFSAYYKYFPRVIRYNRNKLPLQNSCCVSSKGYARGVEFSLKGTVHRLSGWMSYTFSRVRERLSGVTFPPKYDRPHFFKAVVRYKISPRTSVGAFFVYSSGSPFTKVIGYIRVPFAEFGSYYPQEVPVEGPRNRWRLPPYHRLDIAFSRKFRWKARPMEFYLDIANVYCRLNVLCYNVRTGDAVIQMPPLITFGVRGKL